MREEIMSVTDNAQQPPEATAAETTNESAQDAVQASQRPSAAPALPEDEMSFAEMFELAEKQARDKKKAQKSASPRSQERGGEGSESSGLIPGRVIQARVVGFSHDSVLLDVGAKAEGVIAKAELVDDEGNLPIKEEDRVEVRVLAVDGDVVQLGKVLAHQSQKNRDSIRQAYELGLPVEGKVSGVNKGGLDVQVNGLRAFCPASQIDLRHVADANVYLGQKLTFRITEFKEGGRNIVVSRRAILAEEQKKAAEETLSKLEKGQILTGRVTTLKDYGAFIDLGGVEGLVHVSEVSHARISKPADALKVGDEVRVQILSIDERKEKEPKEGKENKRESLPAQSKKISLTIKGLEEDPWTRAQNTLKEGQKVRGKVARIQPFGAFVEILPGVDGLIHVSAMSDRRISDPHQVLKVGEEIEATIVTLNFEQRRVGLSLVKTPQELATELGQGSVHQGTVDRIETFGLFVKLPNGARGLVPTAETGTARGADLKKEFQIGATVKVTVLEVDLNSGKIRLSIRSAAEAEERADFTTYLGGANQKAVGGFGTLADKFKSLRK
jgi:small subunit ribosomal protein S1